MQVEMGAKIASKIFQLLKKLDLTGNGISSKFLEQ